MRVEGVSLELWGAVDEIDRRLPPPVREALKHVRVIGRSNLHYNGIKVLGLAHQHAAVIEVELDHLSYASLLETTVHEAAHLYLKTSDEVVVRAQVRAWGFEDPYRLYRTQTPETVARKGD